MPDLGWLFFGASGRVNRSAYALAAALSYIARFFAAYQFIRFSTETEPNMTWASILMVTLIISLWSTVMLSIKRLHDCGMPGAWSIITVFLDVIAVVVLAVLPGTPGPNAYGSGPNQPR